MLKRLFISVVFLFCCIGKISIAAAEIDQNSPQYKDWYAQAIKQIEQQEYQSMLATSAAWTAESNQSTALFAASVSSAGDVNGDGYSDVIIGAYLYNNGQTDEGRAFVYYGSASGLPTTANWTAESDQANSYFGYSVSTAGDVNGDGYSDVIVGASFYTNGQNNEGRVYVYHGSASGLSTTANWTAESNQSYATFGSSVSSAGDVNGDGYSDVIVGAYNYNNGQTEEGRAFAYYGSASGLSATADWTAESNQSYSHFGISVSTAGDVNGDGYFDIIVGAYEYDNSQDDEGRAFVYHGSASGLSTTANWTAEPNQSFASFGYSVSTAGDVNGDGYSDVIVGAYLYDAGNSNEGRAYVYHGSSSGLSVTPNWTAESDQTIANFGNSVSSAGDVNGDGYADVIVGAYQFDNGQAEEGRAYVYYGAASGLSTTANWTAESDQASANFGFSVSTAGDVNGDGYADVIVGSSQYANGQSNEGRAFVYYGASDNDSVRPTVSITSATSNPTSVSLIPITITFSESVTGFAVTDILVSNGSAGNFAGSGTTYTANVTPMAQGIVSINVAQDAASDAAGNGNSAASGLVRTYDTVMPTVGITSISPNFINASPISIAINFDESVTGFTVGDLSVTNGTASNFAGSGNNYTANIAPSVQGTVSVDIAQDAASDAAGNGNSAAPTFSRTYDTSAPTVSLTAPASTTAAAFNVAVSFSESVTGLTASDFTITNGSGNLSGGGSSYTLAVTATAQGAVAVNLAANKAADSAGNNNTASNTTTTTFDSVAPTVAITSAAPNPTNTSPIPITITFSESVTGLAVGDLSVTNGTAGAFSGSGATYTANITPTANGTVLVDIVQGAASDAAGNSNSASPTFSRTYDTSAPSVSLTAPASTTTAVFNVTVSFSESVSGLTAGDFTITNGTATLSGSGSSYTLAVTATAQGVVTVNLGANKAIDAAGNNNTASNTTTTTFDSVAPTVAITSTASNPTNTSPIPITITFSESVTGFAVGDLSVTNGAASSFAGSGTTYTANITPTANGTVSVDIAQGVASDAASNGNSAAPTFSRTYDSTAPSVSLTAPATTATAAFNVAVSFSESVSGLTAGDFTITNGTATLSGSGSSYTLAVTATAQGAVTVNLAANKAADSAGNNNTASNTTSTTFDSVAPTVAITSTASNPTNTSPIPITIIFTESVTGFAVGDLSVTNGNADSFAGSGTTYTANVTPTANGTVSVDLAQGVASDAAGNGNSAAPTFSRTYDSSSPTVSLGASATTTTAVFNVAVSFSESVSGLTAGDFTITNGTATLSGSDNSYTLAVTATAQGAVTVNLGANKAVDSAGNNNTASNTTSTTFDSTAPTVAITSAAPNPTNTQPIPITITFSESVTGFAVGDLSVTNGAAGSFAGSGTTYTANITPTANGTVSVDIAQGAASDAAGNGNSAATTFSRTYDSTVPTVSLSAPANTTTAAFNVAVSFSESVSGLTSSDFTITNGTATLSGSGSSYTLAVTATTQGAVTVNLAANKATDAAGNNNTASNTTTTTFDSAGPTVAITSAAPNPTNTQPIPITITFSESVTGFAVGDLSVTNGAAGSFAGSGTTYTANITPTANGTVSVDIAQSAASDAAGNGNSAAATFSRTYDNTSPNTDSDSDALSDTDEATHGTDPNNPDTDNDGVMDGQEVTDGSAPLDRGSNLPVLPTTICSLWNGFLQNPAPAMYNIMEHVNLSNAPITVSSTLYSIAGVAQSTTQFTIASGAQRDLLVHGLTGWKLNSYGQICSTVIGGNPGDLDGRMVYYKPNNSGRFEFAFAIPFSDGIKGSQFVPFNTYQPSLASADAANVVANWIQITNQESSAQSGTVYFYNANGSLLGQFNVSLGAKARRDFAAHQYGASKVGLVEFRPNTNSAKFGMQNVRYYHDNTSFANSFDGAFELDATVGNGQGISVPMDTVGSTSVLEVANTKDTTLNVRVRVYDLSGTQKLNQSFNLAAHASRHLIMNDVLVSQKGVAYVTVTDNVVDSVIATAMQYGYTANKIQTLYGIPAKQALGAVLRGTYNTYLNQNCSLFITNPTSSIQNANIRMVRLNGAVVVAGQSVSVPANGGFLYDACSQDIDNTYGVVTTTPTNPNTIYTTIIRQGNLDDYRFPTLSRQ